uniref:Uncharacterized protein n=1 Tax=mine drainage metagenome TaxID=410659 RepID=E6PH15_9ZZZZ
MRIARAGRGAVWTCYTNACMAPAELWLQVLAWTKTLFEATKAAIDLEQTFQKYARDPETIREAQRVSIAFSTYSLAEVESLLHRLEGCRERFISQGGGKDRAKCICSVLNEARDGNGGQLPLIDDWRNIYDQLQCSRAGLAGESQQS